MKVCTVPGLFVPAFGGPGRGRSRALVSPDFSSTSRSIASGPVSAIPLMLCLSAAPRPPPAAHPCARVRRAISQRQPVAASIIGGPDLSCRRTKSSRGCREASQVPATIVDTRDAPFGLSLAVSVRRGRAAVRAGAPPRSRDADAARASHSARRGARPAVAGRAEARGSAAARSPQLGGVRIF